MDGLLTHAALWFRSLEVYYSPALGYPTYSVHQLTPYIYSSLTVLDGKALARHYLVLSVECERLVHLMQGQDLCQ
jgi:hypothetical protein